MKLLNIISVLILIVNGCSTSRHVGTESKCVSQYDTILQKKIYSFVDEMPQYPDGTEEFLKFILKNLEYSEQEVYQGTINYTFVVDIDGKLLDKRIYNKNVTDYTPIDKKALELLDKISKWEIGKCDGKKVPVRIILPVKL